MRDHLAISSDATPRSRNCPDVNGRNRFVALGKKPQVRLIKRKFIKDERVVSAAIKIKERHCTD